MTHSGRQRRHGSVTRSERGQATVEFALVLPLLLLLTVAVVQVARVTAHQIAVVDAARAGARVAAVGPDDAAVRAALERTPDHAVRVERVDGDPGLVTVSVTGSVQLLPGLGFSTIHPAAASTMAVETPP